MATHLDGCAYRPQMKPCVGGSVHFSFLLRGNQSISVLRNWEREEESMDIRKWWKQRMSWESGMLSSWRLGLSSCGYKLKNRWVSSACVLLPQLTLVIYIRFWWISWLVETQLGDLSLSENVMKDAPLDFDSQELLFLMKNGGVPTAIHMQIFVYYWVGV